MKPQPTLPLTRFVESLDFMRHSRSGRWKWVTLRDIVVPFNSSITHGGAVYSCYCGDNGPWLVISPTCMKIRAGYAWDGSSCSPDLAGVMLASLVHDALYQFSGCDSWPFYINRTFADDLFLELASSRLRLLYRIGLACFSSLCWARPPRGGELVTKAYLVKP